MNRSSQRLRSMPGQLALLGLMFFCAVVLGLVILCLRVSVFERYSHETYSPPDDFAEQAGRILANPKSTEEQVKEVGRKLAERMNPSTINQQQSKAQLKDLEGLYGAWMRDESFDRGGDLAKRLTRLQPDWVFRRLRTTLVAGSPAQQSRALVWLRSIAEDQSNKGQIEMLANYARRKAERCGDRDVLQMADAVLAFVGPRDGVP
jgi:hypothetical protein